MDIDLLSKMVKELIPDHDRVSLPGFGYFVTEVVPSSFSDRGYTINPPYRRISFRTGNAGEDTLLADLYASSNAVEPKVAGKIISDFVAEMKKILMVKKTVVFPGLGRMRATKENNFFFVADEDLDIYPEGFGLEPVSLKSHQETREEVSAMISGLQSMMDGSGLSDVPDNADEGAIQPGPGEGQEDKADRDEEAGGDEILEEESTDVAAEASEAAEEGREGATEAEEEAEAGTEETVEETEAETEEKEEDTENETEEKEEETSEIAPAPEDTGSSRRKLSPWKVVLIVIGSIIGLAIILLVVYVLLAHFCPEFIDSILYDSEQLDVIRYGRSLAQDYLSCFIGF